MGGEEGGKEGEEREKGGGRGEVSPRYAPPWQFPQMGQ